MPISQKRVNPHVAREYYARRGNLTRSDAMAVSIEKQERKRTDRFENRRKAMKKEMAGGGLCKCLGG